MDVGHGLDPHLGLAQGRTRALVGELAQLQRDKAGHQLQGVADAVIDLAQHGLGAVAGQADLFLGRFVLALQTTAQQGVLKRRAQQGGEVLGHVLDDIVGGPGAQGGHGDASVLRPGDIDHRRRAGQVQNVGQDVQPLAARHVVIQGADVERARLKRGVTGVGVGGAGHVIAVAAQFLLDQPRQTPVVVDVEQADRGAQISGACMTDRKRPSCWMAPAKAS
ncbi:hypothetical protein D3C85_655920 [compost metagenome]